MSDDLDFGLSRILDSWARGNLHTCMPGVVTEYTDRTVPQVSVQPGFQRLREGADTPQDLPVIENVPIIYPGGSEYMMVYDIPVGTTVMLVFAERSIGTWMQQGGTADPNVDHMFDLSDAVAIPQWLPDTEALPTDVITDGIEIRSRSGDEYIRINDGTIEVNGDETVIQEGTDWAVQFTEMKSAFDDLKNELNSLVTAYNAHIHITTATVGATPTPGVIAPTTSTGTPPVADMSGAKIDDVRLP